MFFRLSIVWAALCGRQHHVGTADQRVVAPAAAPRRRRRRRSPRACRRRAPRRPPPRSTTGPRQVLIRIASGFIRPRASPVDHAPGARVERDVHRHVVGLAEGRLEVDPQGPGGGLDLRRRRHDVVVEDPHPEGGVRDLADPPADVAEADDPDRLAEDVAAHVLRPVHEPAGVQRRHLPGEVLREADHEGEDVLGDRLLVGAGGRDDQHAPLGRRRDVDVVDADPVAADDLQLRAGGVEQGGVDLAVGPGDDRVGPVDLAVERLDLEARGHPDLAGLVEQAHAVVVHRGHHEDHGDGRPWRVGRSRSGRAGFRHGSVPQTARTNSRADDRPPTPCRNGWSGPTDPLG